MTRPAASGITLTRHATHWCGAFTAMANPCELLLETSDQALAWQLTTLAANEARRIETKFSRYRDDSVVHAIHHADGQRMQVDAETAQLIDFGVTLWRLSDGAFDLTSGALRRIWKFHGEARVPEASEIAAMQCFIGWQRVQWQSPFITLPAGMELDFGGIGKEYAVDRATTLLLQAANIPMLINFGGDLRAAGPAPLQGAWQVGIESITQTHSAQSLLKLSQGALATSGDTRRALLHEGRRYGHIIDARTGWPAADAPRSITVAADSCCQAGSYSTLAMLQGANAERFLQQEGVQFWCLR